MVFEIILLRLLAALVVFLLLFWIGALFWRAFNRNPKFDKFSKTINEQPEEDETPSVSPAPTDADAPIGVSRKKYSRSRRADDQPE